MFANVRLSHRQLFVWLGFYWFSHPRFYFTLVYLPIMMQETCFSSQLFFHKLHLTKLQEMRQTNKINNFFHWKYCQCQFRLSYLTSHVCSIKIIHPHYNAISFKILLFWILKHSYILRTAKSSRIIKILQPKVKCAKFWRLVFELDLGKHDFLNC